MKKNNIIIIGSVVAIGVLALLLLKKPDETPKARLQKLKKDSDKKLMELKFQRSISTNFDDIVKIDAQIDTIKNKLKQNGLTDILTEEQISSDLSEIYTKK